MDMHGRVWHYGLWDELERDGFFYSEKIVKEFIRVNLTAVMLVAAH